MGFGLYTTSRLVNSIGKEFILHSGSHKLTGGFLYDSMEENKRIICRIQIISLSLQHERIIT